MSDPPYKNDDIGYIINQYSDTRQMDAEKKNHKGKGMLYALTAFDKTLQTRFKYKTMVSEYKMTGLYYKLVTLYD